MNLRKLPWYDYGGRFSPFKAAVFASLFIPALWIAISYDRGLLGAEPFNAAIRQFGDWTIRLIFIAMVISPARIVLQWPALLEVRRMVGVAAFGYGATHLSLYVADQAFDIPTVVTEIVLRIYLAIGFIALLGITALAITSTDGWQRRLGARRWQKLHRIVYVIGLLAVIHYCLQTKLDEWEPIVMAGIFLWLMSCRVIGKRYGSGKLPLWTMACASILAWALTALGEAVYFWIAMGAPVMLVLNANLSLDTGLRPGWVVLVSTGAVVLLGAIRRRVKPRGKARLKTA